MPIELGTRRLEDTPNKQLKMHSLVRTREATDAAALPHWLDRNLGSCDGVKLIFDVLQPNAPS